MKTENITKAVQSMSFVLDELREAYRDAIEAREEFAVIVFGELLEASGGINIRLENALMAAGILAPQRIDSIPQRVDSITGMLVD